MTSTILTLLLVLVAQATSTQICLAPQSETVFFRTVTMEDLYVAQDFERGLILHVFNSVDGQGDSWSVVDLINRITYVNIAGSGCQFIDHPEPVEERIGYEIFEQCFPDDAELKRSGLVDFYYMDRPSTGNRWLAGVKPVPNTEYKYVHFARLSATGVNGVGAVDHFRVAYKYSQGISDPTVFDKDLSVCVPGSSTK